MKPAQTISSLEFVEFLKIYSIACIPHGQISHLILLHMVYILDLPILKRIKVRRE